MNNLLKADFDRMKNSRVFQNSMFFIVLFIFIRCLVSYVSTEILKVPDTELISFSSLCSGMFFNTIFPIYGIVMALISIFFIGGELSSGTIKNKIIVGKKRRDIYLSNTITCGVAGILIFIIGMIVAVILGATALKGINEIKNIELLKFIVKSIVIIFLYASFYSFIAMLLKDSALATMVGILLIITCGISFMVLWSSSQGDPNADPYITYFDEELGRDITMYNPDYCPMVKKKIYNFILDVTPTGQSIKLVYGGEENLGYNSDLGNIIYAIESSIVINILGICVFNKKELK